MERVLIFPAGQMPYCKDSAIQHPMLERVGFAAFCKCWSYSENSIEREYQADSSEKGKYRKITVKQADDESRNGPSGIDTGALMVLRSAISGEFIPISKPQPETTWFNWR